MVKHLQTQAVAGAESYEVVKFTITGQRFGLPVYQVVEVLRLVAFTKLPESPKGMLGVINFRSEVIPLLDLRQVLGRPAAGLGLDTPVLVTHLNGRKIGLVVDEVLDVGAVSPDVQTASDEILSGMRFVTAVVRLDAGLLLVIDLAALHQTFPRVDVGALQAA